MSGYTPLFNSALDGTLFGKWPHTGIWTCLLSQADKHGVIDKHPNLLAAKIGVPVDQLLACIYDFMQPDPGSRTPDNEGRRLELLEPDRRDWGWRVINHAKYREKARLQSKNAREIESGLNAERMGDRRRPPETAGHSEDAPNSPRKADVTIKLSRDEERADSQLSDSTGPPETAGDRRRPPLQTQIQTYKRARKRASRVPTDFSPDLDLARRELPDIDAEREAQKFRDWEFKTPRSDWAAVWRNWIEQCRESGKYARKSKPPDTSSGRWI